MRKTRRPRTVGAAADIAPGWKGVTSLLLNPRPPSVTAHLELTLEDYYACGSLMGLLAAQHEEPDQAWVEEWSIRMGERMAAAIRRRRLRLATKSRRWIRR